MTVSITINDKIAVILIDNPPVNALSQHVRQGLLEAVDTLNANPSVSAVVLACKGRTFIAGADIREFSQPPAPPDLPDVILKIEQSAKPWIAAIHGTALGGGLEVALGCQYRVAASDARLGFPEVNLGLIPGAGGTVRLPRLTGVESALDMMIKGKPLPAQEAYDKGILDALFDLPKSTDTTTDLLDQAVAFAQQLNVSAPRPALLDLAPPQPADVAVFARTTERLRAKYSGQHAPLAVIDAINNASSLPAMQALISERNTFTSLKQGAQSTALRYLFAAERSATKLDTADTTEAVELEHIGVIGGGTMGAGIAAAALLAGLSVTMIERDESALNAGVERVTTILSDSFARMLISKADHDHMLDAFSGSTDYAALAQCTLVVEAVFEAMDVKQTVFQALDLHCREDAILASNTSYLDINVLATSVKNPSRVIGLHFFSPAHIMKLLEVIVTDKASEVALATGMSFGKRLRKITIPAGVCDGFIGNRIMSSYRRVCDELLEDGAMPTDIDQAMRRFGFPMGIFEMQDLAGLDIGWAMRKRQASTRDPNARYVSIADRLCELGRFGRKTGAGWYRYEGKKAVVDSITTDIILEESTRKQITRKTMDEQFIINTILTTMQQEAKAVLSEGIAQSAEAIDVVLVNGYGFPRWRGGPMFMLG